MSSKDMSKNMLRAALVAATSCATCATMIAGINDFLIVTSDMKCLGIQGIEVKAQACDGSTGQYWREVNDQQLLNWDSKDCLTVNHASGVVYTSPCGDNTNTEQAYIDFRSLIVNGGKNCVGGGECRGLCMTTEGERASAVAIESASEWCGNNGDAQYFNKKLQSVAISNIPSMVGSWVEGSVEASGCSKKCGGGVSSVEYVCKSETFANAYCAGNRPSPVERECNTERCDDWSEYGECSAKTCEDVGYHGRACLKENGNCPGADFKECKPAGCEAESRTEVLEVDDLKQPAKLRVAADGSLWTDFDACSNSCGVGIQTARCADISSKAAGHPCQVYEYTQSCHDNSRPGCNYVHVEDVDGEWRPWEACTTTCGAGIQKRQCINREGNGKDCVSDLDGDTRTCVNAEVCPEGVVSSLTGERGEVVNNVIVRNDPQPVAANGQVRSEVGDGGPQGSRITGGMDSSGGFAVTSGGRTEESNRDQVDGGNQQVQGSNAYANGGYNAVYSAPQTFDSQSYTGFGASTDSTFGTTGSTFGSTGSTFGSSDTSTGFGTTSGTSTFGTTSGTNTFGTTSGANTFGTTSGTSTGFGTTTGTSTFGTTTGTSTGFGTTSVDSFTFDDSGFEDFEDFDEEEFDDLDDFDDFDDEDWFFNAFERRRRSVDAEDVFEQLDNVFPMSLSLLGVVCLVVASVFGTFMAIKAGSKSSHSKYREGDIFQV
ncbi:hypothetical protein SARC_05336 [Sphaeroforma arctica JP610]|uniref:Uncharacterized protein n=1 Tax=Sphaeroforma arctica JP610 TaxID=667725 RepID=A0A0L0FZY8_9EUKA|nr:hypothetical protein SARC_05336 [Sphaeroforma arctica JP610]KNC82385.1 hypothetical protein SARC_05336 [Sphaeroforma arctica JP610]|eukprot:XP_014156287.1 hypothetical protein SARC_05336 [Sphaeroforma arctica JP610]